MCVCRDQLSGPQMPVRLCRLAAQCSGWYAPYQLGGSVSFFTSQGNMGSFQSTSQVLSLSCLILPGSLPFYIRRIKSQPLFVTCINWCLLLLQFGLSCPFSVARTVAARLTSSLLFEHPSSFLLPLLECAPRPPFPS